MKSFPWQVLLDWYSENGRHDYPWRRYSHDNKKSNIEHLDTIPSYDIPYTSHDVLFYRVWLAEILLQQTQADRVVPFYERILRQYPTIQDLATASYDEFFPYYQGLGYYSRAKNLLKTANIVIRDYAGVFPMDKKELKALPGVGEYTARAILAFGYGKTILAWDTNLETIFSRYYKGAKNIKLSDDEKNEIERDFQSFVATISTKNKEDTIQEILLTRNTNNALMDWARLSEPKNARLFDKKTYIFKESEFYVSDGKHEIVEKKISPSFPTPDAQIVVILHQDHRIYYSLSRDLYSPPMLPPSEDRDTRGSVQRYFRQTYGLELSVRPIHQKWITQDGKPYVVVHAQIQTGDISQLVPYSKKEAQAVIQSLYKS